MDVDAAYIPDLAAALALTGLGAWVVAIDVKRRLHRAFGLLMFVLAFTVLNFVFALRGNLAQSLFVYGCLATPFALANFALVFWRSYGERRPGPPAPWWRLARWMLLAGALAVGGLYAQDATLWDGWLGVFIVIGPATGAAVAFGVGWHYLRMPSGQKRDALFLFALGFILDPAFYVGSRIAGWSWTADAAQTTAISIAALAVLLVLVLAVLFAYGARKSDRHARRQAWALGVLSLTAILTGVAVALIPAHSHGAFTTRLHAVLLHTIGSAWRLTFAALAAYSIIRYCLFTLNPRFRRLVRETGMAAALGATLFISEQLLQQFVQDKIPTATIGGGPAWILAWLGAAGAVAMVFFPVHKACSRLALRAAPAGRSREDHERHCVEIYRAALNAARQDGFISPQERSALHRLADNLGLAPKQVQVIESASGPDEEPMRLPTMA
ncbi:MAG: hypothetical protein V4510_07400 [bacterium]